MKLYVQTKNAKMCSLLLRKTWITRLIRRLLYGQTKKQRNKNTNNYICFPAGVQAFSWLSSVTGLQSKRHKNNCSKSSFLQTSSMNEDKIFHTGSMKKLEVKTTIYEKWPKVHLQCKWGQFVPRSFSDKLSFSLAIFDWSPQKTLMLNVQPSSLSICAPAKIAWGWICWTVKTFCCVVVEVLTWFSSFSSDVPGSRSRAHDATKFG